MGYFGVVMKYQIQAVTWRGDASDQQDSILINNKVYRDDGLMTRLVECDEFCVAVADGVSSSPYSAWASRTLLELVNTMYAKSGAVDFVELQNQLNQALTDDKYEGASSTLVCAYSVGDGVVLKHLGDSRAYHYDGKSWQCLTQDHSFINELSADGMMDVGSYASCYKALMGCFVVQDMADMSLIDMASHQVLNLKQGESLLLCSDGLSDVLDGCLLPMNDKEDLKDWLYGSLKQVKETQPRQWLDNVSAVLVRCVK